jgi:hypothetical protein
MMMEVASHFGRGPLQVEVIAQSQGILRKYIHVLAAGLLHALRGPNGGCEVALAIDGALSDNTLSDLERRELDRRKKTNPPHT